MKKTSLVFAAIIAAILSLTGIGLGTSTAATPKTSLGGGSGILVLKGGNSASACTVTAVGHPTSGANKGRLIALTAGHCGKPGQQILSERAQNRGVIGTITRSYSDIDVAVIELDAAKVRPVRTVGGVTIKRISTRPVSFPTIVCKEGRTTGNTCGVTWFSDRTAHFSQMCVIEGDSGSPVVVGDTLVGMVNAYYFVSCIGPETGTNMNTILRRLNATGYSGFKVV
ncbi:S1 family peptidase [Gordonia alkaliphila]|uniref:Protease n=1 Tax=Gordonia alkaliphila TaxID=1053547 RepID=A0ABP8Z4B2_9ACTN|nr:S1 family peptidase [Gordonia alkaliphila]MCK0438008.1 S1 family peptidase [Gordonia alkaliphila]